jgi:hypothetical protein
MLLDLGPTLNAFVVGFLGMILGPSDLIPDKGLKSSAVRTWDMKPSLV